MVQNPYLFCPVDQEQLPSAEYAYPIPLYLLNQQPVSKPSISDYYQPSLGVVSNDLYSNWNQLPETAEYLFDSQQMIPQEPYFSEYPVDASGLYMTGYPTTSYSLGVGFEEPTALPLQMDQTQTYFSPSGTPNSQLWYQEPARFDFAHYSQFPESMTSSPSEESLSPRSIRNSWLDEPSHDQYADDQEEEPLQGLGLYDCPDLTMDEVESGLCSRRLSLGKGLKLEESFQLNEDCLDEDDEEKEEEEDWESPPQPTPQGVFGLVPWPHSTFVPN
ncbi:hypothetical protein ABW19_dt0202655 [Dactylella cylindrospora]|nr:hypothetical protein ABW19_dt0202655 [Dactylella cylindrospora]